MMKKSKGFREKNPVDNPEAFDKVSEGKRMINGEMVDYVEVTSKGKKTGDYESARHEQIVELAKETILMVANEMEKIYRGFKDSLPEAQEVLAPLVLKKFIEADERLMKKNKEEEYESFKKLMDGFFVGAKEDT